MLKKQKLSHFDDFCVLAPLCGFKSLKEIGQRAVGVAIDVKVIGSEGVAHHGCHRVVVGRPCVDVRLPHIASGQWRKSISV